MFGREKIRKEKPPSYGIPSLVSGTIITLILSYIIHYVAITTDAKQPMVGTIIAGSLLWVGITLLIFWLMNVRGNRGGKRIEEK